MCKGNCINACQTKCNKLNEETEFMKIAIIILSLIFGASLTQKIKWTMVDFKEDFFTYASMLIIGMYSFVFDKASDLMTFLGIDFSGHLQDAIIEANVKGFINMVWAVITAGMIFFGKRIFEWIWKKIKKYFK